MRVFKTVMIWGFLKRGAGANMRLPLLLALVLALASYGVAVAASQHSISGAVVSTGGDDRTSPSYVVHDVIGEPAVGRSESTGYSLRAGYVPSALPPCTPGDANGDSDVNMADVTYTELIILGYMEPTCGADANGDGDINMGDVTSIELMILGYL